MGFIRFLFILIIVYYGFKLLSRYLFPFLLKRFVKKAQQKMGVEPEVDVKKAKKKIGQVNIDYIPKKAKKKQDPRDSKASEDYVDFEDVSE